MNTQTTVALARQYFGALVPNDPTNPTNDLFLQALNIGLEGVTNSGKWKSAIQELTVQPTINLLGTLSNGADGYITLPRRYLGALGTRFGCVPCPVFGQWYTYVSSGPGKICPTWPTMGVLIDDGDGKPSQRMIPPGIFGTLQVGITNAADAGKTVRLFGLANDETQIYDALGMGYNVTTAYPMSASNNQLVSLLEMVQGPMVTDAPPVYFKGNWSLWFNPVGTNIPGQAVPSGPIQIGQYEPTEQIPCYHRYLCGNLQSNPAQPGAYAVAIMAQRRYIQLVAETDPVEPGDLSALRYMILGGNHDLALRYDKAKEAYDLATERLNNSTRAARAGARVEAEMNQSGGYGGGGYGYGAGAGGYGYGISGGFPQNVV